jgi:glycine hydroxymethyltransferase
VFAQGMTGLIAEKALEECSITVNKNRIPGDTLPATITSGLRLGTNTLALRGMDDSEMFQCYRLIQRVLSAVTVLNEKSYLLDAAVREDIRAEVRELCDSFPIPRYPAATSSNSIYGFASFAGHRSEKI